MKRLLGAHHQQTVEDLPIDDVVLRITKLNAGLRDFWSSSQGWAPLEAANLLSKARLDWQASLSLALNSWTKPVNEAETASVQILGYAPAYGRRRTTYSFHSLAAAQRRR